MDRILKAHISTESLPQMWERNKRTLTCRVVLFIFSVIVLISGNAMLKSDSEFSLPLGFVFFLWDANVILITLVSLSKNMNRVQTRENMDERRI